MKQGGPLDGVKILDLTRLLPGPMCTLHLADMGAEVIKIEDAAAGDYASPAVRALVNRNKRGLRLDLKRPAAVQAFIRLAEGADAVVEGFRPGVMDRLGLGYDRLASLNPRLVVCSISGYGQTGPYRDRAGHDLNYSGYAGLAEQNGIDADTPAQANLPVADLLGGTTTAAMALLAALFDARRSGQGRHVDVSIADCALAHAVLPLATLNAHGATRPAGADTLSGALACYAQYRTADGRFMAVAALEAKFWHVLCDVLGREDLKVLHRQPQAQAHLRAELTDLFSRATQAGWMNRFAGIDCCVSPVLRVEEALVNPHFRARGMVLDEGATPQLAFPVQMSRFRFRVRRPAPQPGEHSRDVLREAGLTELECDQALDLTPLPELR